MRKEVVLADGTSPTGITLYHEALQAIDFQVEATLKVTEAVLNGPLVERHPRRHRGQLQRLGVAESTVHAGVDHHLGD